jgi:hypothetical protein
MRGSSSRTEYAVLDRGSACLQCKRRKKALLSPFSLVIAALMFSHSISAVMAPNLSVDPAFVLALQTNANFPDLQLPS